MYNIYLHVLIMQYNSVELYLCVPAVKVFQQLIILLNL